MCIDFNYLGRNEGACIAFSDGNYVAHKKPIFPHENGTICSPSNSHFLFAWKNNVLEIYINLKGLE